MRVTLRQLLALLDSSSLDWDQRAELSRQLDRDAQLQLQARRIRQAMNGDNVGAVAPAAELPACDANHVAAYLDARLGRRQARQLDRAALDSIELLSELGDCHRLLARLPLLAPAEVSPALREQLYGLEPAGSAGRENERDSGSIPVSLPALGWGYTAQPEGRPRLDPNSAGVKCWDPKWRHSARGLIAWLAVTAAILVALSALTRWFSG